MTSFLVLLDADQSRLPSFLIRLASTRQGRVMADYRVVFFNNLLNSNGKPFKCLQRTITVSFAKDAGEASEKAKREFERLEGVTNWKCHAHFLEVESRDIVRG
jgi:hypothetical protein